jgi:hypothetical protein
MGFGGLLYIILLMLFTETGNLRKTNRMILMVKIDAYLTRRRNRKGG